MTSAEAHATAEPLESAQVETNPHQLSRIRRIAGKTAVGLVAGGVFGGLAGAAYGAFSPTAIEIGPHDATAQLTVDGRYTFDLGPLGDATHASSLPGGIGIKVVGKGIPVPAEQSALASVASVVGQYEQLLVDPAHIKAKAEATVRKRVRNDSTDSAVLFGLAGIGAAGLHERKRQRKEDGLARAQATIQSSALTPAEKLQLNTDLCADIHPRSRRGLAAATALAMALVACNSDIPQPSTGPNPAIDHALDGTPFEGFAIHGELLRLAVDEAAPKIKTYVETNSAAYNATTANFHKTFDARFAGAPLDHENLLYVLSISDNHCNIGMDRVHAAIAQKFGADLVIDSGDTTMGGTAAEAECVSAFADSMHGVHVPVVGIRGNHDSDITEQQEARDGVTVIGDNKMIQSVGGLTILGVGDARKTRFGEGTQLYDSNYTIEDEGDDLAAAAAKAQPDIIVVHDPDAAVKAVTEGSTYLSISGDTHHLSGPNLLNTRTYSYQFTEGTSGGAKPGALTVGPLQQDAIETIFALDKTTHRPVGYYVITSHPNKTVDISPFTYMPVTPADLSPAGGVNHD